ncbi:DUF3920 family protein [Priestia megaterium]
MKAFIYGAERTVYQQVGNWYVLDEDFSFDLAWLKHKIEQHTQPSSIPVVFCDSCDANKLVSELGEEECEWLQFAAGIYWREVNIIFIFSFDHLPTLVETIFHELRHLEQESIDGLKECFATDKLLPYEERETEKDAFAIGKKKLHLFSLANVEEMKHYQI